MRNTSLLKVLTDIGWLDGLLLLCWNELELKGLLLEELFSRYSGCFDEAERML